MKSEKVILVYYRNLDKKPEDDSITEVKEETNSEEGSLLGGQTRESNV